VESVPPSAHNVALMGNAPQYQPSVPEAVPIAGRAINPSTGFVSVAHGHSHLMNSFPTSYPQESTPQHVMQTNVPPAYFPVAAPPPSYHPSFPVTYLPPTSMIIWQQHLTIPTPYLNPKRSRSDEQNYCRYSSSAEESSSSNSCHKSKRRGRRKFFRSNVKSRSRRRYQRADPNGRKSSSYRKSSYSQQSGSSDDSFISDTSFAASVKYSRSKNDKSFPCRSHDHKRECR
jgi:hypothetical protein